MNVLGAYIDQVDGVRPQTTDDCFAVIDSLTQDEGPSTAVNLLRSQLQTAQRDINDAVAEVANVERANDDSLVEARWVARQEISQHLVDRWLHHLGKDREINSVQELRNDIDLLYESRRCGLSVWAEREKENQRATEAATRVDEVTAERDTATTARDATVAAEADMRS